MSSGDRYDVRRNHLGSAHCAKAPAQWLRRSSQRVCSAVALRFHKQPQVGKWENEEEDGINTEVRIICIPCQLRVGGIPDLAKSDLALMSHITGGVLNKNEMEATMKCRMTFKI